MLKSIGRKIAQFSLAICLVLVLLAPIATPSISPTINGDCAGTGGSTCPE